LKEQLLLLEELQRHDAKLQELEGELKTLPEKLQSSKNDLAKMEALLEKERFELSETERFRREQESSLKDMEGNVSKAKSKLQGVKTGKDYMAAQREIEATRKMMGDREEEILKLLAVIESAKKTIAAHEGDVGQLRDHVGSQEAQTMARVRDVEKTVAEARAAREQVAAKVKPEVLKRYGSIRLRRGLAVVPVVNGTCKGCHMMIPPQLYNMIQRGLSLETCPSCNRIIYWEELMKEKKLDEGEA
jgi:uncharacterized protein